MGSSSIDSKHDLHDALVADHAKLERRFEAMLEEMHAGAARDQSAEWTRFEEALLGHFDAEEQHLLPIFEAHDPDAADAIRRDHEQIRARLRDLGIGVDLRTVREQSVRELVQMLRDHAAREETLYRFADSQADEQATKSVLERLRRHR